VVPGGREQYPALSSLNGEPGAEFILEKKEQIKDDPPADCPAERAGANEAAAKAF
jgi:hypothetical protein